MLGISSSSSSSSSTKPMGFQEGGSEDSDTGGGPSPNLVVDGVRFDTGVASLNDVCWSDGGAMMGGVFVCSTCMSFDDWTGGFEELRMGGAGSGAREVVSTSCVGFSGTCGGD